MSKFRLDQQADVNMTHLVGYVSAVPARLIEVFGPPTGGDYKVSGEYAFVREDDGRVVTLYDWKATTLYEEEKFRTPEMLWSGREPFVFHVGARVGIDNSGFSEWLEEQLKEDE